MFITLSVTRILKTRRFRIWRNLLAKPIRRRNRDRLGRIRYLALHLCLFQARGAPVFAVHHCFAPIANLIYFEET